VLILSLDILLLLCYESSVHHPSLLAGSSWAMETALTVLSPYMADRFR
jgi:hypothetical protein